MATLSDPRTDSTPSDAAHSTPAVPDQGSSVLALFSANPPDHGMAVGESSQDGVDPELDQLAQGIADIPTGLQARAATDETAAVNAMIQSAESECVDILAAMEAVDASSSQDTTDTSDSHASEGRPHSSEDPAHPQTAEQPHNDEDFFAAQAKRDEETLRAAAELNKNTQQELRQAEKQRLRREHHQRVQEQNDRVMKRHERTQVARKTQRKQRHANHHGHREGSRTASSAPENASQPYGLLSPDMQQYINLYQAAGEHSRAEQHQFATEFKTMSNESYPVEIVHDRKIMGEDMGVWYEVRFTDGSEVWNPREALVEDGLEENCKIVDDWFDKNKCATQPFERYYRGTQTGWSLMKASPNSDCVVAAVNALFEVSHRPAPVTDEVWTTFMEHNHFTKNEGISQRKIEALLKTLDDNTPKPHVYRKYLNKWNNLYKGNGKGISGLFNLDLSVGKYLVDCFITGHARHCMALEVVPGNSLQVFDEGQWIPATEAETFLLKIEGVYHFIFENETGFAPPKDRHHKRHHDSEAPSNKKAKRD